MSRSRRLPASVEKALLVGLGVVAVVAAMTPLAPGGGMVAPDLLYAVIVAWVIRRPAATPLWAVLALGLFADVMLSRPIGLGALGLLFASEFFRARAATFHGVPFPLEWLAAAVVFAAMLAAIAARAHGRCRRTARGRPARRAISLPPSSPIRSWCSGSPGACGCARRRRSASATRWAGCDEARPHAPPPRITRRGADAARPPGRGDRRARLADARPADRAERALPAPRRGEPGQPAADPAGARHHHRPRGPAARRQPAELPHRRWCASRPRDPKAVLARLATIIDLPPDRPGAGAAGDERAQRLRAGRGHRAPHLGRRGAGRGQHAGAARGDPRGRPQPLLPRRAEHRARDRLRRAGLRERPRQARGPRPPAADPALPDRQDRDRVPARAGAARPGRQPQDRGQRRRPGDARARPRRGHRRARTCS